MREQRTRRRQIVEHGLRHPVVQQRQQCRAIGRGERSIIARGDAKADAALDPQHRGEPAIPGDVGGLRRPRRDRSGSGDHQNEITGLVRGFVVRSVGQNPLERGPLGRREVTAGFDEVPVRGADAGDGVVRSGGREGGEELGKPERRERMAPAQREKLRHGRQGGCKRRLYSPPGRRRRHTAPAMRAIPSVPRQFNAAGTAPFRTAGTTGAWPVSLRVPARSR